MMNDDETLRDVEYLKRYLDAKSKSDDLHRESVVASGFDRRDMSEALKKVNEFKVMHSEMGEEFDQGFPLVEDMFQAFNKHSPTLRDPDEMREDSVIIREAIKEMMKLPEFEDLKEYTSGDRVNSALSASTMGPKVRDIMGELKEKQDALEEIMEQMEQGVSDEELDEALEQLGEGMSQIRKSLREGLQEAQDEMDQIDGMSNLWSDDPSDPGNHKKMNAEERLKLAQRLRQNKNLARLAELIGSFKSFAFAMQRRKTDQVQTDIYDIELGNDLSHTLPSEFGLLRRESTRKEFHRKYSERSLGQYSLRGTEQVGKGGIVCLVDTSGSMTGERDVFAKAVALTLLRIAQRQERNFHGMLFSSATQLKQYDLTHASPEEVLEFATFSYGHSTSFETPLNAAMEVLQREHEMDDVMKSDIVMVTDGYCGVSDAFMERLTEFKENLGARVFGVQIDIADIGEPLNSITDGRVFPIKDLNSPVELSDIFRSV